MEPNNSTWPYDSENAKNLVEAINRLSTPTPPGPYENGSNWPYDNTDMMNIVEALNNFKRGNNITLLGKQTNFDFNTSGQPILLHGGASFCVTEIVVTNMSGPCNFAKDMNFNDQALQAGNPVFCSTTFPFPTYPAPFDALQSLNSTISFLKFSELAAAKLVTTGAALTSWPVQNNVQGNQLWVSLGAVEAAPLTGDIYIFGFGI